jgi:exopolysaccharide biosynthesis WecB/TagA/CpsF family protein
MHDFSGGGVERMRLRLSAALAARGLSVTIIVHANRGSLAGAVPAGIAVVDLATRRTAADILPLRRLLREQAYDLVISSLNHNNVCVLLARLMAGGRTPVIICQHNALGAEGSLSWKHRVVPIFYFLLWRLASAIVAVSDGVAHDLAATAGIPSKAITTIVNPVIGADLCSLANGPAPHPWLEHCAMPTFLFVGRLTRQKDPETLLHAMALLLKSQPARLILLGQGELFGQLVELTARLGLSECVCFPGFQENPLPWIRHASALVLCSRYEGLGNVLIEALACGTPVIATDCPFGPSEILRGGALGRLVPVGDAATMAHAMRDYATQGVSPAARRARAREFSVDRCADQHERLIARVLKGRRATSKKVFGLEMASLDADVCASHILTTPADGSVKLVVTPNINHIRHMRRSEFFTACQSASLVCADGLPVALYARLVGLRIKGRVTGCDVFHRLTASPAVKSQRLFFVVESERTSAAAKLWAQSQGMLTQTGIAVAAKDLACNPVGQHLLLDAIDRHKPTILVMTLGAPVSEVFIHRNRANLPGCWALCVGQALRVELGLAVRAPRSWQVCGLEWAWRAVREPRRLAVRYVFDALYFPVAVVRDLLSQFS